MIKKIVVFLFLLNSLCLWSLDEDTLSTVFEKSESGVVLVSQSLYFDSRSVENKSLFTVIEEEYEIEILDSHLNLGTGTGFFITKDGFLITNHHVIDQSGVDELKKDFLSKVRNFVNQIPSSVLSSTDRILLYDDFVTMIKKARVSFRVLVDNNDIYEAELTQSDSDLDLALLKADGTDFHAIPLVDSDSLKVGNSVVAIGYPIPGALFSVVKDIKSTMTIGNVSSIRSDNWGIQHTAAINPGNSGGPLLNSEGGIIGINVGAMTNANDMYFSIPAGKLVDWLVSINYNSLIEQNSEEAKGIGKRYKVNEEGYLETGRMIFIDLPEGYTVFVNGKKAGVTPYFLKNMKTGKYTIRIENEFEYAQQKFLIQDKDEEIFKYNPRMDKHKGKLFVNTVPMKAEIYLNGEKKGTSPLVLNQVNVGVYELAIKKNGFVTEKEKIEIFRDKTLEKEYSLEKGYRILFEQTLPEDSIVEVKNKNKKYTFEPEDVIVVANGTWKVTVQSKSLLPKTETVVIDNEDITIDLGDNYILSKVVLVNLQKESRVYLNGEEITSQLEEGTFKTVVGEHRLKVEKENYETINKTITVTSDKEVKVELQYTKMKKYKTYSELSTQERNFRAYLGLGIAASALGFGLTVGGIALIVVSSEITSSTTTSSTQSYGLFGSDLSTPFLIGGVVMDIFGPTILFSSLFFFIAAGVNYSYRQRAGKMQNKEKMTFRPILDYDFREVTLGLQIRI